MTRQIERHNAPIRL